MSADIRSFCYPFGRHNRSSVAAVKNAGYALGRTNVSHSTRRENSLRQSVTWQMYPHSTASYVKHGVKYLHFPSVIQALRWRRKGGELAAVRQIAESGDNDSVIHLWGHSWEIDDNDMWLELGATLSVLGDLPGATFLTNQDAYIREGV